MMRYGQCVGGMHPTGMHSCFDLKNEIRKIHIQLGDSQTELNNLL